MELYTVEITEVLQRQIDVVAKNPLHAWETVDKMYSECKVVLNESDLVSQQIDVLE